jgi:general secretion pathway protein N
MKKRYVLGVCSAVVLGILVLKAPAEWLSPWVSHYSRGTVSFERSWGTVWQGAAQLRVHRSSKETVLLPQPIAWDLGVRKADVGVEVSATIQSAALAALVKLTGTRALSWNTPIHIAVAAGQYQLPVNSLNSLGAPFNTIKPSGQVSVSWREFTQISTNTTPPAATLSLDITRLRTALTGADILGDYQLSMTPVADSRWSLNLITRNDTAHIPALILNGSGSASAQGAIQFELRAKVAHPETSQHLGALLNFLGRNEGEEHVLRIQ